MKLKIKWLLAIALVSSCNHKSPQTNQSQKIEIDSLVYDSTLAKKLGADKYGMKKYIMAFLYAGPKRPTDKQQASELQEAHLKNIKKLAEEGKLVLAGPFLDTGKLRGIYIFNVQNIAEAEALTETDPAIQHGSLKMELKPWYGSAALIEVNKWHAKIAASDF